MLRCMPARPIASGNVSFGLVSIPVKLYSTGESSSGVRFNWLDAKHGVRLKQQYISSKDERVVPREERIKGYEFAKGQFVTFTDQELKDLSEKVSPTIDIAEFVPLDQIDPMYYEKADLLLAQAPKAQIVDLMEALKASLGVDAKSGPQGVEAESGRKPARRSPRRAKKTASRRKAAAN